HRRDTDQVRLEVEVDRLDVLVGQHDLVLIAGDGGGDGEQAGQRRIEGPIEVLRTRGQRVRLGVDQMDDAATHGRAPLDRGSFAVARPCDVRPPNGTAAGGGTASAGSDSRAAGKGRLSLAPWLASRAASGRAFRIGRSPTWMLAAGGGCPSTTGRTCGMRWPGSPRSTSRTRRL